MTTVELQRLARIVDTDVMTLLSYGVNGMSLFSLMSHRLPDLKALWESAGPSGMEALAHQFPHLGRFAELLASCPREAPVARLTPPQPQSPQGQKNTRKTYLLPVRLKGAAAILARIDGPDAADAQSASREAASRIANLEEALCGLLVGKMGAAEQARQVLAVPHEPSQTVHQSRW